MARGLKLKRSPLLPIATLATNLSISFSNVASFMQSNSSGSSGSPQQLSPEMEQKILYGERRPPNSDRIVGAHSPRIKTSPDFIFTSLINNPDGTTTAFDLIKRFPDGTFSRKKRRSTFAPDSWNDEKIIDVTKQVASTNAVDTNTQGATLHRQTVDLVEWEVIKDSLGNVMSSYPTGGIPTTNF